MTSASADISRIELSDVAETALATLFCRALESASEAPIVHDPAAETVAARLRPGLAESDRPLQRSLAAGEVEEAMRVYVALRSRHFDRCARDFLARHPGAVIVNLGGGLDTRCDRLGSPPGFCTIDLPEMIGLREALLGEGGVAADVRDFAWMNIVAERATGPVMFLAEGLLMYLTAEDNRRLFVELARRFPGSEIVAEVFNSFWLGRERRRVIDERLSGALRFGSAARFVSGFAAGDEPVAWAPGIRLLEEWSFVDEDEAKLGRLKKLRHFPMFRKRQWTVRYALG